MRSATIWEVAVLVLFLVLVLPGLNAAYSDAVVERSVDNESHVVNYSDPSELRANGVVEYGNATVRNTTFDVLVNNTDYQYDRTDGTITWFNTTNTTDGEEAFVSYNYTTRQAQAQAVGAVFGPLSTVLGWLPWMAAIGALLYYGVRSGGF